MVGNRDNRAENELANTERHSQQGISKTPFLSEDYVWSTMPIKKCNPGHRMNLRVLFVLLRFTIINIYATEQLHTPLRKAATLNNNSWSSCSLQHRQFRDLSLVCDCWECPWQTTHGHSAKQPHRLKCVNCNPLVVLRLFMPRPAPLHEDHCSTVTVVHWTLNLDP